MFEFDVSRQAEKFLKKCDKQLTSRILDKLNGLAVEPVPHNAVRIVGEERTFRVRIGDYRVLYEIDWQNKIIIIVVIDKRPHAYD